MNDDDADGYSQRQMRHPRQPFFIRQLNPNGQIAIGFVAVLAVLLFLVVMTVNVGQMAQVRVETSNAADAGALAAASWMASGENEAAMIAGRMYDAIAMVQAIYLVPFCPGDSSRQYAEQLWASLYATPAFLTVAQGPIWWWKEVADAALRSSMDVGRREFMTASVNNLMIRFNNAAVGVWGDGGLSVDPTGGNLMESVRGYQESMYNSRGATGIGGLNWNNGLPIDHPLHRAHTSDIYMEDYPQQPPTLQLINWQAPYWPYRPATFFFSEEWSIFDCEFEGVGITDTMSNGGPLVSLGYTTLPTNPLSVLPLNGRKGWELNMGRIIPSIGHSMPEREIHVGLCPDHVCGMEEQMTPAVQLWPASITNTGGARDITVTISHEAQRGDGMTGTFFGPVPVWEPQFQEVASRARAHYTSANDSVGFVPYITPNAIAYLEEGAE